MTVPHDVGAEQALLASLICDPSRMDETRHLVAPSDFYVPLHQRVYGVIDRLYLEGRLRSYDVVTLVDALRAEGVGQAEVVDLLDDRVWSPQHARIVVRLSTARRVLFAAEEIKTAANAATMEPDELIDAAQAALSRIELPATSDQRIARLRTVEEFLGDVDATPKPWVVDGLLRRGWRCVIVAGEGSGKTVLMRAIAVAAAAGVHPLAHSSVKPVTSLIVDLENPEDAIAETLGPLHRRAHAIDPTAKDRTWIEHRPEGVDLRSRTGRLDLEAVIQVAQPDLVCMGPIYKMYRTKASESDELAAGEVMAFLDDMRHRYGFALVLEHHAPKGGAGGRDILPHGTSLWLRWPELGLKLTRAQAKNVFDVGRWRADRVKCAWPDQVKRGGDWLWTGIYPYGLEEAS